MLKSRSKKRIPEMLPKKKWYDVEGYENIYQINILGEVISYARKLPFYLKVRLTNKGYPSFTVSKNNIQHVKYIHRELAKIFIPNPKNKPFINHKDGIKTNFSLSNLEWCTNAENMHHAAIMGLKKGCEWHKNNKTKLNPNQVLQIVELSKTLTSKIIAMRFNISPSAVQRIKNGKYWGSITQIKKAS